MRLHCNKKSPLKMQLYCTATWCSDDTQWPPLLIPHFLFTRRTHQYQPIPTNTITIPTNTSLYQYPPIPSPQPPTPDNILFCFASEVWVCESLMVGSIVEQQEVAANISQIETPGVGSRFFGGGSYHLSEARSKHLALAPDFLGPWHWSMSFIMIRRWQLSDARRKIWLESSQD